jgi:hypothetical protein
MMLGVAAVLPAGCGGGAGSPPVAETSADADAEETSVPAPLHFSKTGWRTDFSRHSVPLTEVRSGGPGKDGIPALDRPELVSVAAADAWLEGREPVIELELAGEARAYPLQILIWHEIVNDEVGGTPVAVTFCPLCNTTIVFDRRLDGLLLEFGTTGNLRNADLVMYDRQTESWWQQFGGEAIVGELTGSRLERMPAQIVSWSDFAERHPNGKVLSRNTGFERPYGQNPYSGYDDVDSPPLFAASNPDDDRLPPKERVVYIESGSEAVAVPLSLLENRQWLELAVGELLLELEFRPGVRSSLDSTFIEEGRTVGSVSVRTLPSGEAVVFDTPFWFAVAAFRPDVRVVTG